MSDSTSFRWTSCASTHAGLVRPINEDAYLNRPERGLWAVADGMGGHTCGDVASRMVVESLDRVSNGASLAQFRAAIYTQLQEVNSQLRKEAAQRRVSVIGSTVAVLLAYENQCNFFWAGDSRIYLYRNNQLLQLTRDHSQVEEMKMHGLLNEDEAFYSSARNIITRAVGAADLLETEDETITVSDGDVFLLCSDGLSNEVNEEEIGFILQSCSCKLATETLIELALAHGGRDNITALVIRVEELSGMETTVMNPSVTL